MPARRTPRWSPAETAALREAYPRGIKAAVEALPNRSVYSINVKAHRLRLKVAVPNYHGRSYKLAGDDLEEALRLREQGWSMLRIGAHFGIAESSASNAIIRAQCLRGGYTPAERINGRLSPEARGRLRWMLKKGLKGVEIQLRLGISAAAVHNERSRYNAELKANGKALLPPPGAGLRYSGVRVPKEKVKEAERLFLAGYGTLKVSRQSGVSKTVCTRIRNRLIGRLKRQGECLPGCNIDGKRRVMIEHGRHVPDQLKAKLRELILARVPIRRAASMCGLGVSFASHFRDDLKAQGVDVPKPRLPGKLNALQREMMKALAIPKGQMWRYRQLVREIGDADRARAALRAELAEARKSRTFEDQLAAVGRGEARIGASLRLRSVDPDFTLGGVATGALG